MRDRGVASSVSWVLAALKSFNVLNGMPGHFRTSAGQKRAAGKALLIPAEAVARRHHTLTSDRTATFAAVAVELVTLLDAESNT